VPLVCFWAVQWDVRKAAELVGAMVLWLAEKKVELMVDWMGF